MERRNPGIDLLRGTAILLVIIHHLALRIPPEKTDASAVLPHFVLHALHWNGGNAVKLFFVISGFLIADHAIRRWGKLGRMEVRVFMLRRAARILPCLFALLAVLAALDLLGARDFVLRRSGQSLPGALAAALLVHLNLYEAWTGYLPPNWDVLWSLSVEEAFYLAFPVLCALLGRWPLVLAGLWGVLAFGAPVAEWGIRHAPDIWQEKAYGPGFCAIGMGVAAALTARSRSGDRLRRKVNRLGMAGAAGVLAYLLQGHVFWLTLGYAAPLFLTLSAAVLIFAFDGGWGAGVTARSAGWVKDWGRCSYEIYLSHMFVVLPAVDLFVALGSPWRWGWAWFPPVLILVWMLGRLVETWLSSPAGRWMRDRLPVIGHPRPEMR
ncbi:acyltransferase family protein [Acidomonas methanolica]|uniref:acyltransferase family protein n=1 Tax=Acidomonas methanolica TaxID=437 RepID=UPI00211A893F|nr:acyltransferase [Acidomonas methanolica]MCQ9155679.1 acyltransferase [Acidomonas methanolica]